MPTDLWSRLAINARFRGQRLTGVQRYAHEVVSRLPAGARELRPDGLLRGHVWEQFGLLALARGSLLWCPANTAPLAVRDQVVTIHDAATLDHPEWFDRGFAAWYRFLLPRLVRRVRRVITVSEHAKERLLHHAGDDVDPEKVTVVPNGVGRVVGAPPPSSTAAAVARLAIDRPYVLALGSLEPRKNLTVLIDAWETLGQRRDHVLVIAGAWNPAFRAVPLHASESVRFLGYVEDAELPALYAGATAFVYPSLYEGFGLPPLEAMAHGTPVIAGDHTGLHESLGGHALLVDVTNRGAIAEGLRVLLDDHGLRTRLSAEGRTHVQEMTWERCASRTRTVLERELGGPGPLRP